MNSQQLLYVYIIVGLFFAAYFFFGRSKPKAPTRLNMKANEDFSKSIIPKSGLNPNLGIQNVVPEPKMTVLEPENVIDISAAKATRAAKNLNIYFMYNGHEWEAHEVLGVPAGAPMPQATEVYQKLILNSDPSTFEFYESAHSALLKRWRDRL